MTKDLKSDRWSCPSDRNLQLRSKLNAGWSYYTNKKSLKKDPQLTENELIEIQKVLQRSEIVERNERERVMKLVDRLENMKRNSSTSSNSTHNTCAICGDYFYILRSSPNQCGFCQKTLCSKCCIDTTCTIDSNSNFSSSTSMVSRRNSSSSMSNQVLGKVYLCRICSEQREFLKKSGAWFLKKYPSYLDNNSLHSTTSSSNLNGNNSEKYNSTSNLSRIEKSSFDDPKPSSFVSPINLRRNISTSSATFRFWKTKESLQNFLTGNFNNSVHTNSNQPQLYNNDLDNVSTFSNGENEFNNSNYDSITTRTISSENIHLKTPTSPAPSTSLVYNANNNSPFNSSNSNSKCDNLNLNIGTPSSSNYNVNSNNKPKSNENSPKYKNENSPNNKNKNDVNRFNFPNLNKTNEDTNISINKKSPLTNTTKLSSNLNSDEEFLSTSPNMSNYNYYSNILTNINNDKDVSSLDELKKNYDSINKLKKSSNNYVLNNVFKSNFESVNIKANNNDNNPPVSLNSFNSLENAFDKNNNNLSMTENIESSILKKSEIRSRSFKKPKIFEWCSTQLSFEKEDGHHKSSLKLAKQSLSNYLSKKRAMNANYNNSNDNINGKSKNIMNLFKKNGHQHESISDLSDLKTDSIAAKSSSAVSSASSLTASLSKLNTK